MNHIYIDHVYVKFIHDKAAFVQPRISVLKLPIPEGLSRWWDALGLWGMSLNLTLTVISPEDISPETEN